MKLHNILNNISEQCEAFNLISSKIESYHPTGEQSLIQNRINNKFKNLTEQFKSIDKGEKRSPAVDKTTRTMKSSETKATSFSGEKALTNKEAEIASLKSEVKTLKDKLDKLYKIHQQSLNVIE
jgi:hypothetical protein